MKAKDAQKLVKKLEKANALYERADSIYSEVQEQLEEAANAGDSE